MLPPSSRASSFAPKFLRDGPMRRHLPLLHDLVAFEKPRVAVILGLQDGQAYLTCAQTAKQSGLATACVGIRRRRPGEHAEDDSSWRNVLEQSDEFFPELSQLHEADPAEAAATWEDGAVDLLLIDDLDSGSELSRELAAWRPKLSANAVVLFHGINLERDDSLKRAWTESFADWKNARFPDGIGLAIATRDPGSSELRRLVFSETANTVESYHLVAQLMWERYRTRRAEMHAKARDVRQFWFDALFQDRKKAQEIMEHQGRAMVELEKSLTAVCADRDAAQEVMDSQVQQMANMAGALDRLQSELTSAVAQVAKNKRELALAKQPKPKRTLAQRLQREWARFQRKRKTRKGGGEPAREILDPDEERYAKWIIANEPDAKRLGEQRKEMEHWTGRPLISLLLPVHNTPPKFLDELFASLENQTNDCWECRVVDGGSSARETINLLRRWGKRDSRIKIERLPQNLGIAENTNRALAEARGEMVAFIDHDDVLAPFALYEVACATREHPHAEIFYSDEDRLTASGDRARPFFKPEWSPELLYSCMYLGHLTAYRRDFLLALGGLRKEFDLSQDYDLALRATERAREIVHLPYVLYHWREHAASGASGGKPAARQTNLVALTDAVKRRKLDADVLEYPTANRVRMRLPAGRRVSVVIPTDSAAHAEKCVYDLPGQTDFARAEFILVTNSALAHQLQESERKLPANVRFSIYDQPFNFSAKCNAGARLAEGDRLIFLNDDVEAEERDWIENVIEPLENPEVGAVAPKLLYPNGLIQHAGMVSGVRDFPGTAFHQQPADTTMHVNFAQSMRDVSILSGACLALRRADFLAIDGFDEINVPISHSDVDLCFKVRERGWRCVYTPFATLKHVGHASLSQSAPVPHPGRDQSTLYLLRRWGRKITRDPYFTNNMRDWLFADSPTPIRMFAEDDSAPSGGKGNLLFVSHDLSSSGAPLFMFHLAVWCRQQGIFVVVMSPADGPLREKLQGEKIPVVVDPLIATGHESLRRFVKNFDVVIANTVRSPHAMIAARREKIPAGWYLHETEVGDYFLRRDPAVRAALPLAPLLFAASERSLDVFRPYRNGAVRRLISGCPDLRPAANGNRPADGWVRFIILGTIERRKGQDVLLEAIKKLPQELSARARFEIVGSGLDPVFLQKFGQQVGARQNVTWREGVDHVTALRLLAEADVLICPSRDESMPLVILEAMSFAKVIIASAVGGIPEYLSDGENALLVPPEDAAALAEAITRVMRDPSAARTLGEKARARYEKAHTIECYGGSFIDLLGTISPVFASR